MCDGDKCGWQTNLPYRVLTSCIQSINFPFSLLITLERHTIPLKALQVLAMSIIFQLLVWDIMFLCAVGNSSFKIHTEVKFSQGRVTPFLLSILSAELNNNLPLKVSASVRCCHLGWQKKQDKKRGQRFSSLSFFLSFFCPSLVSGWLLVCPSCYTLA